MSMSIFLWNTKISKTEKNNNKYVEIYKNIKYILKNNNKSTTKLLKRTKFKLKLKLKI